MSISDHKVGDSTMPAGADGTPEGAAVAVPPPLPEPVRPAYVAALIIAIGFGLRTWLAGSLDLQKDETAYWAWSRDFDAAFALLPLAAIRASCALFGDTAWAVRLPFLLAATGAAACAWTFTRATGAPAAIAAWTVALFSVNLWFHFAGAQAHPDAFLAFFWMASLTALATSVREETKGRAAWLYAGAALAAGAASSKYTGFLLWPGWLLAEFLAGSGRAHEWKQNGIASLIWIALTAPALAAIAATDGEPLRMALALSDLSERLSPAARLMALPAAPLLVLLSPTFLVWAAGLLRAARAVGGPDARYARMTMPTAAVLVVVALKGSVKGNWALPAFWGTIHAGVAWLRGRPASRGLLWGLTLAGAIVVLALQWALLAPDRFLSRFEGAPGFASLDSTYAWTASTPELQHASARLWSDRIYDLHGQRATAESTATRAEAWGGHAVVMSDLYEVVYRTKFYDRGRPVLLLGDTRLSHVPEHRTAGQPLPDRAIYVTQRGTQLPEEFFLWYGYLERQRPLVVPLGRAAAFMGPEQDPLDRVRARRYDVWRCARVDE